MGLRDGVLVLFLPDTSQGSRHALTTHKCACGFAGEFHQCPSPHDQCARPCCFPGPHRREYHGETRGARREYLRIWTPQGEKVGGVLEYRPAGVVLVKVVQSERHQVRLPRVAWALDCRVVAAAEAAGVKRVEIHDRAGSVWWARLVDFRERGVTIDRGYGEQVALDVSYWTFLPADSVTARCRSLYPKVGV